MRFAAALLAAFALLATPAAVLAQSNPLGPLPTPAPAPAETVVVAQDDDGGDGLKGWQQALILGAGIVLLAGIAWAIVSDARSRAPVKEGEIAHPGLEHAPKRNRSQKQRERDRAKAKLARQQRKRNRGR
jgi:hypothetical protein